jgi:FKBP-type peptidyl-prolyl cis-trans isomerase FkpA
MNRAIYPLALCLVVLATACGKLNGIWSNPPAASPPAVVATNEFKAPVYEVKIEDIKVGTGTVAVAGRGVTIQHSGWLADGTRIDSSKDLKETLSFFLGNGSVMKGWDQGLVGMKVGGIRKLTIPPELGYGASGTVGMIPPNATLVYRIELLGVNEDAP